jgi:hypothetical protein
MSLINNLRIKNFYTDSWDRDILRQDAVFVQGLLGIIFCVIEAKR